MSQPFKEIYHLPLPIVLRSIWDRCLRRGVDDLVVMKARFRLDGFIDVNHVGAKVNCDLESVCCRRGLWTYRGDRS